MGQNTPNAPKFICPNQKYSRLRCLLHVKGWVICFSLGWSGSILQFRQNTINVGSKSWLLACSSKITLSLPSYTCSALNRERNFFNGYLSLLYICAWSQKCPQIQDFGVAAWFCLYSVLAKEKICWLQSTVALEFRFEMNQPYL